MTNIEQIRKPQVPRRTYSYVIVVTSQGADLFKAYESGSVHLAGFHSSSEAMAWLRGVPPAPNGTVII